ncbi:MAG: gamma-glutamyl-gamma-aminobutyrate hydrolase family protein [Solirubrobacterales bacterium]
MNPSARPVIAITPVPRDVDTGYGGDRADTVARGFGDAVVAAGGVPISLPQVPPALAAVQLAGVDGLILSGGQDIDLPGATGDDRWVDAGRDRHEFALWEAARAAGIPVLGVCRGLQLANVALGGSLITHVEGHDAAGRHAGELQEVEVEEGTLLAGILGAGPCLVNTIHHQAVGEPGEGLRVSARSADGTVEAAELAGDPWFVGVQWHPELLPGRPAGDALFAALVEQARR